MVITKPAHLAMPTCEMPPTLHLCCKGTKKSVTSNKSSGFFFILMLFFLHYRLFIATHTQLLQGLYSLLISLILPRKSS